MYIHSHLVGVGLDEVAVRVVLLPLQVRHLRIIYTCIHMRGLGDIGVDLVSQSSRSSPMDGWIGVWGGVPGLD